MSLVAVFSLYYLRVWSPPPPHGDVRLLNASLQLPSASPVEQAAAAEERHERLNPNTESELEHNHSLDLQS